MQKFNIHRYLVIGLFLIFSSCVTKRISDSEIQNILQQTLCKVNDSISEADKSLDLTKDFPMKIRQDSKIISYEIGNRIITKTIKDTIKESKQKLLYDSTTGKILASFSFVGRNFFGRNFTFDENGNAILSSNNQFTTKICPLQAIALAKKYFDNSYNNGEWRLEIGTYYTKSVWIASYNILGAEKNMQFVLYIDANTGVLLKRKKITTK